MYLSGKFHDTKFSCWLNFLGRYNSSVWQVSRYTEFSCRLISNVCYNSSIIERVTKSLCRLNFKVCYNASVRRTKSNHSLKILACSQWSMQLCFFPKIDMKGFLTSAVENCCSIYLFHWKESEEKVSENACCT